MLSYYRKWRRDANEPLSSDSYDVESKLRKLKQIISTIQPNYSTSDIIGSNFFHRGYSRGPGLDRRDMGVSCDEVYNHLYVGDEASARNKNYLRLVGITHVINTAEGLNFAQVNTGAHYYRDCNIKYMGLNLMDIESARISIHFGETADFIDQAIVGGGRVLVHCFMGMSRSATIALAYLMIKKNMTAEEALKTVRRNRGVRPNEGFLRQLIDLELRLRTSGSLSR